jgi:hypothetical protein
MRPQCVEPSCPPPCRAHQALERASDIKRRHAHSCQDECERTVCTRSAKANGRRGSAPSQRSSVEPARPRTLGTHAWHHAPVRSCGAPRAPSCALPRGRCYGPGNRHGLFGPHRCRHAPTVLSWTSQGHHPPGAPAPGRPSAVSRRGPFCISGIGHPPPWGQDGGSLRWRGQPGAISECVGRSDLNGARWGHGTGRRQGPSRRHWPSGWGLGNPLTGGSLPEHRGPSVAWAASALLR